MSAKASLYYPLAQSIQRLPHVYSHDVDTFRRHDLAELIKVPQHLGQVVAPNLMGICFVKRVY